MEHIRPLNIHVRVEVISNPSAMHGCECVRAEMEMEARSEDNSERHSGPISLGSTPVRLF